jgi:hypothetical protein
MVRPIVALLLVLGVLLVLGGPATADSETGQGDGQANGQGQGQGNTSSSTSGNATASSDQSSTAATTSRTEASRASPSPTPGPGQATACRVVGTHLNDPRVPKTEWVRPDPDGCFQRIIYYALGIPPGSNPVATQIRRP